jgi:1-acyl-sn-glycerol-3-phosphate acyltransferase
MTDASAPRWWRVLGTGASFALFGVGGVLLWLVVFPLLALFVRDPARRARIARRLVHRSFGGFMRFMRGVGVLTFEVSGGERLRRDGLLVLANHPTLIDIVFLVSLLPNADCVVRSGLARNPFTRGPINATGYVSNADGAALIEDCVASVAGGSTLVIFPEGTRSPFDGGLQPLQRGAANVAVRGRIDVTPVLIRCTPPTLRKGEKWYRVPPRRFHISIEVLPDLPVGPFVADTPEPLAARRLTEHLALFFATELARARART